MIAPFKAILPKKQYLEVVPTFNYGPRSRVNSETFDAVLNSTTKEVKSVYNSFIEDNYFKTDQASIFAYHQKRPKGSSRGIVCTISLNEYLNGNIKLHEKIYTKRANVFSSYLDEVPAQVEPIVLVSEDKGFAEQLSSIAFEKTFNREGVVHAFKVIEHEQINIQSQTFLLTDGHHRLEALKIFAEKTQRDDISILVFITTPSEIQLFPYHREIILPPNGQKFVRQFLATESCFSIHEIPKNLAENEVIIQLSYRELIMVKFNMNNWESTNSPVDRDLLDAVLNISNAGKSENVLSIPGERSIQTLSKMPLAEGRIRIFYPSLSFDKFKEVALNHKTLRPKSTWIQPKMLAGLFISEL